MPAQSRAVVAPELTFLGNVTLENGQRFNIASFPGIYQDIWKRLTRSKRISCSCVFFPDGHILFGKHMQVGPGRCKCFDLYGQVKPWGCQWFSRWDTNTQEAVNMNLPLIVVYKRGFRLGSRRLIRKFTKFTGLRIYRIGIDLIRAAI